MMNGLKEFLSTAPTVPAIDAEQFYAHGYALYQSGRAKDAVDVFRVLSARQPFELRFWFGLGASLQEDRSYSEALCAWAMAALLEPADPYPHFHAAECAYSLHQKDEALKALAEAKARIKDSSHPLKGPVELLEERWS